MSRENPETPEDPDHDEGAGPRVILIGSMGAGKTTVGQALARRWGLPFRDTDDDIVASEQRSIADIFVTDGEESFRALERHHVACALAEHRGVLALGGGSVVDERTRALIAGQTVVFLQVGLTEAVQRVGLGSTRPMLLGNVRGRVKALLDERTPIYRSVASFEVLTDGIGPDEVAEQISLRLGPARV